jgi:hypothetical protein
MSAPTKAEAMVDRVLAGELRGAVAQAKTDVEDLDACVRSCLAHLDCGSPCTSAASRLGQSARTAVASLLGVAIVHGKIEGVALARSVLS